MRTYAFLFLHALFSLMCMWCINGRRKYGNKHARTLSAVALGRVCALIPHPYLLFLPEPMHARTKAGTKRLGRTRTCICTSCPA
ncbi:hypothetical protein K438DRAFT_374063 [Mycena galopus ATCC 62051]|nr:hypothetical protein K438DRAFT_374063 [Mycena galopus ATCC 62051]